MSHLQSFLTSQRTLKSRPSDPHRYVRKSTPSNAQNRMHRGSAGPISVKWGVPPGWGLAGSAACTEPEDRARSGEAQTTRNIGMAGRRWRPRRLAARGLPSYGTLRHCHSRWALPWGRVGGVGSRVSHNVMSELLFWAINSQLPPEGFALQVVLRPKHCQTGSDQKRTAVLPGMWPLASARGSPRHHFPSEDTTCHLITYLHQT